MGDENGNGKPNGNGQSGDGKPGNGQPPGITRGASGSITMDADEDVPPGAVLEHAAAAVRFVLASVKIELDFTKDTLSLLDHYVTEARESLKERPEALALTAHAIGAYLGEVVRRKHVCWWRIDHADPASWRLEFRTVYLAFYPVEVAYAVLTMQEDDEETGGISGLELPDEDRDALTARLAEIPGVSEEEYFSASTRLDVLDIAVDALLAKRARDPNPVRPYTPADYG